MAPNRVQTLRHRSGPLADYVLTDARNYSVLATRRSRGRIFETNDGWHSMDTLLGKSLPEAAPLGPLDPETTLRRRFDFH